VLAVLVGAGLRRNELAELNFSKLRTRPVQSVQRPILHVTGKGAKDRIVPISAELNSILLDWRLTVRGGRVARAVRKGDNIGPSLSPMGIWNIVNDAGTAIGQPELAPHDLRRTFAQIAYENGIALSQISTLLGHADIKTTMEYLDLRLDFDMTASDMVPLT